MTTDMMVGPAEVAENLTVADIGEPASQTETSDNRISDELRTIAENKGWFQSGNLDQEAVLKSYQELEKKLGSSLSLPAKEDEAGWREFYSKLGCPKSAEGYAFKNEDEYTPGIFKPIKEKMHQLGLTQKQATELLSCYQKSTADFVRRQDEAEMGALKDEWGKNYPQKVAGVQAVVREFIGNDPEMENLLARTYTLPRVMKLMDRIYEAVSEDSAGAAGMRSLSVSRNDRPWTDEEIVREAFGML